MPALYLLLFEGFEHLDADGPLTFFGRLPDVEVITVGYPRAGPDELPTSSIDWLLVPGGVGTRSLVQDPTFCTQLAAIAQRASLCMSVCTGSALLAAAGCLDGHKATSNKRSWAWASAQGAGRVQWVHQARGYGNAGKVWAQANTSTTGAVKARMLADEVEYEGHYDSQWDPFAALYKANAAT